MFADPNRVPLTEVHLLSEEFDGYSVSSEGTSVTFCLKELRVHRSHVIIPNP